MWRALIGVLWGALLVVIGLALAANHREIATRHIGLAERVVRPFSPARRTNWTADRLTRRRNRFVVLDRLLGLVITLFGVVALVNGGRLLLSGLS
ncbi:hypothetical protein ACFQZ8_14925 [Micromonospora azadirachtae]|uniref:Uncharacterized protein n=1 Tax=Micromonospora azadirachtae TaxID=1970735 RepID=A0ABW3A2S4_9ACTN